MRETLVKTEEFKDSPVGRIPKDWDVKTLGELGNFQNGLNKGKKDFGFGTKFVNILDVYPQRLNISVLGRMNASQSEISSYQLEVGDILLDRSSVKLDGVGYPTVFEGADEPIIFCGFIIRFRLSTSAVKPRFLCELMRDEFFRNRIFQIATRSANVNVNQEQLAKLWVAFPPVSEQEQIIEILNTIDEAIAHTSSLIAKLKQMKAGLLHDLLTRGLDENGELRDAIAHPEQFKDLPLGQIPKNWEVVPLTTLCHKITDGSHQSVKTSDTGVPFLYVSCVRDGQILWEQAAKIPEQTYAEISKGREPVPGLILYTAVGSYGHAALVREKYQFSFQRHIAYILANSESVEPAYLAMWLNSTQGRKYADQVALGNAQKTVTLGELASFPVLLPEIDEQRRITEILDTHDTRIRAEEAYREKLKLQKQGLMHDLLTGKVRVKNA
jgi:type I restriction enzyme S subunit